MAKRVLEKFVAELSADDAKFNRTLKRSSKEAAEWGRKVRRGLSTGIVVGGGAALVGLTALVKKTSESIDASAKFADVIGLTTEQLSGYQIAAKITGVEMGQLNTGLTRMLKNVGDAEDGLSTATRALDKLGLSAEELKKLSTDEQIKLIADRFQQLDNPVDKASVSLNLFGRSGIALGKMLEQGSEGIERFQEEAEALGFSISRVDAAKIELANDAMARTNFVAEAAGRSLTIELAPIIAAITEDFVEAAKKAGGMGDAIVNAVDTALTPIGWLADGVHTITLAWQGVEAAALSTFSVIAKTQTFQARALVGAADLVGFNESLTGARKLIDSVDSLVEDAARARKDFADGLLEPLPSQKIKAFVNDARKSAQEAAEEALSSGVGKPSPDTGPTPAELAAQAKADKIADAAHKARLARGASLTESVLKPNELYKIQLAEIDELLQRNIISEETHTRKQLEYKAALDESTGVTEQYSEAQRILAEQIPALDAELQALADDQSLLNKAWLEGQLTATQFASAMSSIDQKMVDLQDEAAKADETLSVFADQAARNIQDSLGNAINDLINGTEDWERTFIKSLLNIVAQAAAADLAGSLNLPGSSGGNLAGLASAAGSVFGGFFADGGHPDPNKISIVGEQGPELFIPNGLRGEIVPAHQLNGGSSQTEPTSINAVTVLDANSIAGVLGSPEMGTTFINQVKVNRSEFRAALGLTS